MTFTSENLWATEREFPFECSTCEGCGKTWRAEREPFRCCESRRRFSKGIFRFSFNNVFPAFPWRMREARVGEKFMTNNVELNFVENRKWKILDLKIIFATFSHSRHFLSSCKTYKPIKRQHLHWRKSPRKGTRRRTINYDILTEIFKEEENFLLNVFYLQNKNSIGNTRQSYNTIEGENENACCKLKFFGVLFQGIFHLQMGKVFPSASERFGEFVSSRKVIKYEIFIKTRAERSSSFKPVHRLKAHKFRRKVEEKRENIYRSL